MEIKRFFADKADYADGRIVISGEEFLHLTKVLRYKTGYKAIVNLDDENDYSGTVESIFKDYAVIKVDEITPNLCKTRAQVTLFQALPKGDKLDYIVQKCVELGVKQIVPFTSAYTNETKYNAVRQNRIALEACKQCGRSLKCEVSPLNDFEGILKELSGYDTVIMPYERATKGSMAKVSGIEAGKKIALIIGSEGGFAPKEVEAAKEKGAQIVSLGKRILRCETAAVIAAGLVMYELGELKDE